MDYHKVKAILDRTYIIGAQYSLRTIDRFTLSLQIMQMHEQIDLSKLLSFTDMDFVHDVYGINQHVKPDSTEFTDCWYPRSGI